jgi:hypothetical protein
VKYRARSAALSRISGSEVVVSVAREVSRPILAVCLPSILRIVSKSERTQASISAISFCNESWERIFDACLKAL